MDRGMTADQILAALWRRKVLIGAIAAIGFAVGAAIVASLPSVYTASAVVRVEPQRPSEEMVQHTVSELIEQRLLTVREELLARPVLQRAIEELNLYPEIVADDGIEAGVERMRRDLDVKVEGDTAFELTYSASDPQVAAKVANRLPEIFSEETIKIRQAQAARATAVFDEELGRLQGTVAQWEDKILRFKVEHLGELPEQLETNMRGVERLNAQLTTKTDELRATEARRSELARSHAGADTDAGRLAAAEADTTRALTAARSQWTADHPEVQRLARELETVSQQRQDAERRMVAERQERARAAALVTQIQRDIDGLKQQAQAFQKRIDQTPRWAQELSVLQRDYEILRTKYQSVVSRKVEAEVAQELEAKSSKSLFNVISPAGAPSSASRPDRVGGLIIALLAALGIAVLTGVVLEMRDESIRDAAEIKGRLPLPVLAVVPMMQGARAGRRTLAPSNGRNTVAGDGLN